MSENDDWVWEMPPPEQQTRSQRLFLRLFGEERCLRWARAIDRKVEASERRLNPQGEDRCPWRTPLAGDQCVRRVRHKGVCRTRTSITGKDSGRTFTQEREWYGINYKTEA